MEEQPPPSPHKPPPNSTSILHKALYLLIFLILIPFFPSMAPEFLNQTPLPRSWELIHLLLVGLAVSYGLFSRRNTDSDLGKDSPRKTNPTHMAVASIFEDDEELERLVGLHENTETHVWNSRYYRGEPKVVLAGESHGSSKPLCLPVRSLRSQVSNVGSTENERLVDGFLDSRTKKEEEDEFMSDSVRRSPIPWSARSARTDRKIEPLSSAALALSPSVLEDELPPLKTQSLRSRRPSSPSSSSSSVSLPYKIIPAPSLPPPPPPPPPPPGPFSRSLHTPERFQKRQMSRDELEESRHGSRSGGREQNKGESFLPQPTPAPKVQELGSSKKVKRRNRSSRNFIIDSDNDAESEESSSGGEASSSVTEAEADVNEVDKKADEFIAKFREQIRLQRIESIKRSTAQHKRSK